MTRQDFTDAVHHALAAPPANRELALGLLSGDTGRPCFVIGRNEQASSLASLLRLEGLVDDYAEANATWTGLPVVSAARLPADAIVINCSTSISPVAVERALRTAGVNTVLSLHELTDAAAGAIPWPWFVEQQREDWRLFQDEWGDLFERMADGPSQQTLLDVLRYRLTADPGHMQAYEVRLKEQYFEDFLDLSSEVFVDAGGFDGDTTEEFCLRCPDYRQVHLFEPSRRNLAAAKLRLKPYRDISFRSEGLSDRPGVVRFDPDAGSASAVSSDAAEEVRMTTLDEAVTEPVSFIKMDLEGWELKALAGCERHIREDRPKLAIAVYHHARDFRAISAYVRSLRDDYRLHLRHYTQGWSETVMFFV